MTNILYYKEITDILSDARRELISNEEKMRSIENDIEGKNFTNEYKQKVLTPKLRELKNQEENIKFTSLSEINKKTNNYLVEIVKKNQLKSEDITDDIKLLTIGIKLSPSDIESLFDKNKDNDTMKRIICDYASQNDIKINRIYSNQYSNTIEILYAISDSANVVLNNYYSDKAFDSLFGENSLIGESLRGY